MLNKTYNIENVKMSSKSQGDAAKWGFLDSVHRIVGLAWFDVVRSIRGTALGLVWFIVKPAIYIFAFWFAVDIGLRAGSIEEGCSYIVWLSSGIIPWFAMSDMLRVGSDVYSRYPYLITRQKFSQVGISLFFCLSVILVQIFLVSVFVVVALLFHIEFGPFILQLPFLIVLMFVFFTSVSILLSPLSALCKDIRNLVRALVTPLFWFSGILFNVSTLGIEWVKAVMMFNPITFFSSSYRASLCENYWLWERQDMLVCFLAVLCITMLCAWMSFRRWHKVVPDVV